MRSLHDSILPILLLILLAAPATHAADRASTWTGGGDSLSWTDPDNWSTATFPNNNGFTYDALIGDGFTVAWQTEDDALEELAIEGLSIGSGSTVTLGAEGFSFQTPDVFTLHADSTNDGQLDLFRLDELRIGADLTLGGSGETRLIGTNIVSLTDAEFAIGPDQALRIVPGGQTTTVSLFGFGKLTNRGIIETTVPEDDLRTVISAFGDEPLNLVNTGTLGSRSGGLSIFEGVDVDQTGGGQVVVEPGSTARFQTYIGQFGSSVTGGTIAGGGLVEVTDGIFEDLLLDGMTVEAKGLTVRGTVTNDGTIELPGSSGKLLVEGEAAIGGTGVVLFGNPFTFLTGGEIAGGDGDRLTLGPNQTLRLDNEFTEADLNADIVAEGPVEVPAGVLNVGRLLSIRNSMTIGSDATVNMNGVFEIRGGELTVASGATIGGSVGNTVRFIDATLTGDGEADLSAFDGALGGDSVFDIPVIFDGSIDVEGPATIGGSGGWTGGRFVPDDDPDTDDSLTIGPAQVLRTGDSPLRFEVPVTNEGAIEAETDSLTFTQPVVNNGQVTIGDRLATVEGNVTGSGAFTVEGDDAFQGLAVRGVDTFGNTVDGTGRVAFDSEDATDSTTTVTAPWAFAGTTIFETGATVFNQPADSLGTVEMKQGSGTPTVARFTGGLAAIGSLNMEGFGEKELFVDGDTTLAFGGQNDLWRGTLSGPGATTIGGPALASGATLDGRTAIVEDTLTVASGGLDLVNGARLINLSSETLTSGDFGTGVIDSSDGAGVLENRGRVTNGADAFNGNPIGLDVAARVEQSSTGVTEASGSIRFFGGGQIDGQVLLSDTAAVLPEVTFGSSGADVSYTFPASSSIEGPGNVTFDGTDFSGAGSLSATVEGAYRLTDDNSTTRVENGAGVTIVTGPDTALGSQVTVDGGQLTLSGPEIAIGRSALRTRTTDTDLGFVVNELFLRHGGTFIADRLFERTLEINEFVMSGGVFTDNRNGVANGYDSIAEFRVQSGGSPDEPNRLENATIRTDAMQVFASLFLVDSTVEVADGGEARVDDTVNGSTSSTIRLAGDGELTVERRGMLEDVHVESREDGSFFNFGASYFLTDRIEARAFYGREFKTWDDPEDPFAGKFDFKYNGLRVGGALSGGGFSLHREGDHDGFLFDATVLESDESFRLGFGEGDNLTRLALANTPGRAPIEADRLLLADGLFTEVELAGTAQGESYDVLEVIGALDLGGSELYLLFLDGFQDDVLPEDIFEIVTATELDGAFGNAAPGSRLATADGFGTFRIDYGPASPFDPDTVVLSDFEIVPEPASIALLGLVVLGLTRRRR